MENLITNPGAEVPASNPLYPLNWGLYWGDAIRWTWGRISPGYLSSYSAFFNIIEARADSINMAISPFPCDGYTSVGTVSIYPGKPYYLEFYINSSFNNVMAHLFYWRQDGSRVQTGITLNEGNVKNTNGMWVKRTATFTTPLNIVSGAILFRVMSQDGSDTTPGMAFYVDDVFFGTEYVPPVCPSSIPCFSYTVKDNIVHLDASCSKGGTIGLEEKPIINYIWDFGDGSLGKGLSTQHEYYVAGSYTVTLSTQNDCEQNPQLLSTMITVKNPPSPPPPPPQTLYYDLVIGVVIGTIISSLVLLMIKNKHKSKI